MFSETEIEALFDTLAAELDRVGPEHESLLLTKLVLLLAHALGDATTVTEAIAIARKEVGSLSCE